MRQIALILHCDGKNAGREHTNKMAAQNDEISQMHSMFCWLTIIIINYNNDDNIIRL